MFTFTVLVYTKWVHAVFRSSDVHAGCPNFTLSQLSHLSETEKLFFSSCQFFQEMFINIKMFKFSVYAVVLIKFIPFQNIRKRTSEADKQHAPLTTTIKSVEDLIRE